MININADLLQWSITFLLKILNQRPLDLAARELAGELHNQIIRTFNERKGYSLFIDNIWGADLADMEL